MREFGFRVETLALPAQPSEDDYQFFDWKLDYFEKDEFDPGLPPSPAHLVRASLALGLPVQQVAARLAAYGITVPEQLPDRVLAVDMKLLSQDGDGLPPWFSYRASITLPELLTASSHAGVEPAHGAARLSAYGLKVQDGPFPKEIDKPRLRLLSKDFFPRGRRLRPDRPVPRFHLIRASVELGISPRAAAEWLAECGMTLPPGDIDDAANPMDLVLMRHRRNGPDVWLDVDEPVPLFHLLWVTGKLRMGLRQVAERLRWLGLEVPDVDESIAAALRRVPWMSAP
uniref:wHTH domain-containing protein n=1 Tax=Actinomadura spongiicola TaxID=2303421 RepID=UPI0013142610|nr:hypothetical protein [Actinomadura spongiicola]